MAESEVGPSPSPWDRVRAALSPRRSRGHAAVGVLLFLLGFALAVQVQTSEEEALASARTADLVQILDDLAAQRDRLTDESQALERDLDELATSADQAGAARRAARERLQTLQVLAGTLPVEGPGVLITIADTTGSVGAIDILDTVQELRDAGAEALAINDIRVIGSTSFVDTSEGIVIDEMVVQPPYVVRAIGDPSTMATAMAIPGGVIEQITEVGGRVGVVESPTVTIDEVRDLSYPEYASPG